MNPDREQDDVLASFQYANINDVHDESLTIGQKVADAVASGMGSWAFILVQSFVLAAWIILNTMAFVVHWDAYPYILLNLALSFQAAFAAPFILISQKRLRIGWRRSMIIG